MHVRLAAAAAAALTTVAALAVGSAAPVTAAPISSPALATTMTYAVTGAAHVDRSDTDLTVAPTTLVLQGLGEGRVTGDLPVPPTRFRFVTSGGQPATATVSFTQAGAVRGSIFPTAVGTALTLRGSYTMRLSQLRIDGDALDLGRFCTTVTPVVMSASTPSTERFSRSRGGTLAGVFTIPGWHHCNGAEEIIDHEISGSGNTVTLVLRAPVPPPP